MNTKNILLFIFEGFSDWEPAYTTVGISKTDKYKLQTVGLNDKPVHSMGGLKVVPELKVKEVDLSETAMLILPGGAAWEEELPLHTLGEGWKVQNSARKLVGHCLANDIPVAAICAATAFLAREGWLDDISHTSNHPEYLKTLAPGYKGASTYKVKPTVIDDHIITASGTSPITFAKKIFERLGIEREKELKEWFQWFEKFNSETVRLG